MTLTRRVLSGTGQLTVSNGVVRLLAIVTMPILTELLSPEVYGVAALAGTIVSLASVLALAGVDTSYLRAYNSTEPPSGPGAEQYCWRFAMSGALLAGILAGTAWYVLSTHLIDADRHLAIVVALGVVLSVVSTMAQVRALLAGRHSAMALTLLAAGVVGAAAGLGIAFWRQDVLALLLPMLLGSLLSILLLGTPSVAWLAQPSPLTRRDGAVLIKIGLAGVVTAPMYWLLSSSDRWFLQHFRGADAVGVYSVGYSVAVVGMMVNSSLMTIWQPEATREYEQDRARAGVNLGRLMSRLAAAMAIIWLAATAAGGDIVRWLANERFHASAGFVPYIAGGVFFYGVLRLATTGLLLAKQLKWAAFWWLAGGLVSGVLNLAFVPRYGGYGAAMAQCVSFAFIAAGIFITAQTKFRVQLEWSRLIGTLIVVLAAGVVLATPWHEMALYSLLMKLPAGFAVALVVAWMVAPDWCATGVDLLRRRLVDR